MMVRLFKECPGWLKWAATGFSVTLPSWSKDKKLGPQVIRNKREGLLDLPPEVTLPTRTQSGSLNNYAMQTRDIGVLSQTTCCTDFRVVVN